MSGHMTSIICDLKQAYRYMQTLAGVHVVETSFWISRRSLHLVLGVYGCRQLCCCSLTIFISMHCSMCSAATVVTSYPKGDAFTIISYCMLLLASMHSWLHEPMCYMYCTYSLVPRPLLVFQVKSQLKVVWGRSYMTLYTY